MTDNSRGNFNAQAVGLLQWPAPTPIQVMRMPDLSISAMPSAIACALFTAVRCGIAKCPSVHSRTMPRTSGRPIIGLVCVACFFFLLHRNVPTIHHVATNRHHVDSGTCHPRGSNRKGHSSASSHWIGQDWSVSCQQPILLCTAILFYSHLQDLCLRSYALAVLNDILVEKRVSSRR